MRGIMCRDKGVFVAMGVPSVRRRLADLALAGRGLDVTWMWNVVSVCAGGLPFVERLGGMWTAIMIAELVVHDSLR